MLLNIDWELPASDSTMFISVKSREREFISVTMLWLRLIMSRIKPLDSDL